MKFSEKIFFATTFNCTRLDIDCSGRRHLPAARALKWSGKGSYSVQASDAVMCRQQKTDIDAKKQMIRMTSMV